MASRLTTSALPHLTIVALLCAAGSAAAAACPPEESPARDGGHEVIYKFDTDVQGLEGGTMREGSFYFPHMIDGDFDYDVIFEGMDFNPASFSFQPSNALGGRDPYGQVERKIELRRAPRPSAGGRSDLRRYEVELDHGPGGHHPEGARADVFAHVIEDDRGPRSGMWHTEAPPRMRGPGGEGPQVRMFRGGEGDSRGGEFRVGGKAIIEGPDGQWRELNWNNNDDRGGSADRFMEVPGRALRQDAEIKRQIEIELQHAQGAGRGAPREGVWIGRGGAGASGGAIAGEPLKGEWRGGGPDGPMSGAFAGAVAGDAPRCWVGLELGDVEESILRHFELEPGKATVIAKVIEGSPAARAGLAERDIVIQIDGRDGAGPEALRSRVAESQAGEELRMEVLRRGERKKIRVHPEVRVEERVVEGVPFGQPPEPPAPPPAAFQWQRRAEEPARGGGESGIEARLSRLERMLERLLEQESRRQPQRGPRAE